MTRPRNWRTVSIDYRAADNFDGHLTDAQVDAIEAACGALYRGGLGVWMAWHEGEPWTRKVDDLRAENARLREALRDALTHCAKWHGSECWCDTEESPDCALDVAGDLLTSLPETGDKP